MTPAAIAIAASLVIPVSASPLALYNAAPCHAADPDGAKPLIMRIDDWAVKLSGRMFARQTLALGFRRVWIESVTRRAADERVGRVTPSRFLGLEKVVPCSVPLEGQQ